MPTDTSPRAVAKLADTRQAISHYWAQKNLGDPSSNTDMKTSTESTIPHVLAGLALIAVAEKLLRRSTPLRQQSQDFSTLKTAETLLRSAAQRHPGWLMLGAAVVGGSLAATRPWRWLKCSKLLPNLLPHLLTELLARLVTHAPQNGKP